MKFIKFRLQLTFWKRLYTNVRLLRINNLILLEK